MSTIYRHYGSNKFNPDLQPDLNQMRSRTWKPTLGLWASPTDSERNWYNWCQAEYFTVETLETFFDFKLKPSAKIYTIRSYEDIIDLIKMFPGRKMDKAEASCYSLWTDDGQQEITRYINFYEMAKEWDGIEVIISADFRLYHWMYGWDVDSIAIWNYDVIEVV